VAEREWWEGDRPDRWRRESVERVIDLTGGGERVVGELEN
jgi:hypothetical protein